MKKLILSVMVLVSFGAAASDGDDIAGRLMAQYCQVVFADNAEIIMKARQSGMAMGEVISIMDGENDLDIIKSAYSEPRYSTEECKDVAVSNFRDKWHLMCLRAIE